MATLLLLCPPRAVVPSPVRPWTAPAGTADRRALRMRCSAENKGGAGGRGRSDAAVTQSVEARPALQAVLWGAEAAYILWLFLLPYAPGDPVWAISQSTVQDLLGLSLNFFFILPFLNSVSVHLMEAPALHPMAEGLFNFVIGWTLLFAPILYTDCRRGGFKGSLDLLWGLQMFLTNTFLIPYMALRLEDPSMKQSPPKLSKLGTFMVRYASSVGLIGGSVCIISILWALFGRGSGNFGDFADRWSYLQSYLGSERLAYAFIWDIVLYSAFQPWLIWDNLQNVRKEYVEIVKAARFVPVVGLAAYLVCLADAEKQFQ